MTNFIKLTSAAQERLDAGKEIKLEILSALTLARSNNQEVDKKAMAIWVSDQDDAAKFKQLIDLALMPNFSERKEGIL